MKTRPPADTLQLQLHFVTGQQLPLTLCRETREFGNEKIDVFWLDSSELRSQSRERGRQNVQAILAHEQHLMISQQRQEDADWADVLLASCYMIACRNKATQHVLRDAFVARSHSWNAEFRDRQPEIKAAIDEVVGTKQGPEIARHFRALIDAQILRPELALGFDHAFAKILGRGLELRRRDPHAGIAQFVDDVGELVAKLRRKPSDNTPDLVNYFLVQAKMAFGRCYTNLWRTLIPWLHKKYCLTDVNVRFLLFWHSQEQPVTRPSGGSGGRILLPQHMHARLAEEQDPRFPRGISISLVPREPQFDLPILFGQVLALHPIGWQLLQLPGTGEILLKFLDSEAFVHWLDGNQPTRFREYQGVLSQILEAAHIYRIRRDWQRDNRPRNQREITDVIGDRAVAETADVGALWLEVASQLLGSCEKCRTQFTPLPLTEISFNEEHVQVPGQCRRCMARSSVVLPVELLRKRILGDRD